MKVEKKTTLNVPHLGKTISFEYPEFFGDCRSVAREIDAAGLKRPDSSETASLFYNVFQNQEGMCESEIIRNQRERGFWEFTGNLYLPKSSEEINNGVILETNPKITNGDLQDLQMDRESLIDRLQENDPLVRFVPFGFKTGLQEASKLAKNPYIVARYGEEGAEKIAEIASKYKNSPVLYSFDSVDREKTRISFFNHGYNLKNRLEISGDLYDPYDGQAFGVSP